MRAARKKEIIYIGSLIRNIRGGGAGENFMRGNWRDGEVAPFIPPIKPLLSVVKCLSPDSDGDRSVVL